MYQICNETFCLKINEIGAELEEVFINGISVLWKRNELWQRQSPLLFPMIGNVKDGYYIYKDKKYFMAGHGFLKDERFEVVSYQMDKITLKATSNQETLKIFPFSYEFYITYILLNHQLKIMMEVKNIGDEEMLFSVGFHPGLDYDGLKHLLGDSIYLKFYPTQSLQSIEFDPVYVKSIEPLSMPSLMSLSDLSLELQKKKTLCYQGIQQIDLNSQSNILRIKHQMPYLAFWQCKPEAPKFLCIEPWHGLPDMATTNHQLTQKKDILTLASKDSFKTEIEISFLKGVKNENNTL